MKARYIPLTIGSLILFMFLLFAVFPSIFTPYELKEMFTPWEGITKSHILGCNDMGYDIYTEIIYGTRDTVLIAIPAGIFTILIGTIIGILSTNKGIVGSIFNGLIHIFVLLPKLIILIILSTFLARSRIILILLISLFSWVGTAKEVRTKVLRIKEMPFIEALKIAGLGKARIAIHYIANVKDILITRSLLTFTSCMMMESSLSFLGLGDTYHPSWGTMMNFAYKRGAFFRHAYQYLLAPGICISLISLAFYFLSIYFEEKNKAVKEVF